jgi:AcrR family transcriptional regulator
MTDFATVTPLDPPSRESYGPAPSSSFEKRPRRGPGSYNRSLSPEERRDEQRRTLVEAAAHVFARDGYVNASVASILDASGLSRGTFYRHFHDLQQVFFAVQENAAQVLFTRLEAAFHGASDPAEKLRACVRAYLELCTEFGDLSRVMHREAMTSNGDSALLRRNNIQRVADLFRDGLDLAKRRGLVRRVPDNLTILAVIGAIEAVALRYLEEEREHEVLEALDPLVRLGLRAFA